MQKSSQNSSWRWFPPSRSHSNLRKTSPVFSFLKSLYFVAWGSCPRFHQNLTTMSQTFSLQDCYFKHLACYSNRTQAHSASCPFPTNPNRHQRQFTSVVLSELPQSEACAFPPEATEDLSQREGRHLPDKKTKTSKNVKPKKISISSADPVLTSSLLATTPGFSLGEYLNLILQKQRVKCK